MIKKVIYHLAAINLLLLVLAAVPVHAQSDPFGTISPPVAGIEAYGNIEDDGSLTGPINFANNVILFVVFIAGTLLLFNIILTGIKIMGGVNNPKEFNDAMKKILWSVLGLALVAGAYLISGWVINTLFGSDEMVLNPTIQTETQ